jgi:hypothetical protein
VKAVIALLVVALTSCGYHVSGHGDQLPTTIKTIAVPAFSNATTRYKLTDHLPQAIGREFLTRTRYKIVSDPAQADAVLKGTVVNYVAYATIFDPVRSRATAVELHAVLNISLTDRATGKVLFSRPNLEIRERYEISVDPTQYFEESDAALDRVSDQVAKQVVSAILENF